MASEDRDTNDRSDKEKTSEVVRREYIMELKEAVKNIGFLLFMAALAYAGAWITYFLVK